MSGAITAVAAVTAVAATAYSAYSSKRAGDRQAAAAERQAKQAEEAAKQAEQDQNRANRRTPDIMGLLEANTAPGAGLGGTSLTGAQGVDLGAGLLGGGNNLLGG